MDKDMKDSKLKRFLVNMIERGYELQYLWMLRTKYRLRIMNYKKTLKYINKNKCSVTRFGDGEFELAFTKKNLKFQKQSQALSTKLQQVFETPEPNLLICVPRYMNTARGCIASTRKFWIKWGRENDFQKTIVSELREKNGRKYVYGDAHVTRPYFDAKTTRRASYTFGELKKLWENRDLLIVEGEKTRMGCGNDLFASAKSIRRILAPAQDAFCVYDKLLQSVVCNHSGQLVLLALGPTATVLASDLAKNHIWAIDIGHIDIEYEWFLRRSRSKVAIPGKYTNEAMTPFSECEELKRQYETEIISVVS